MSYLKAVARLELKEHAARARSAVRERAGRAIRVAAAHPAKTAAAVASVALVGALVVVSAASAEAPNPHVESRLARAEKKRAAVARLGAEMETVPNTVRVFVHLAADHKISEKERLGMKNAMARDAAEFTYKPHSFEEGPMVKVESGTAIVLARGKCALRELISGARAKAPRVVAMHIGEKGCDFALEEEGWSKYETKVHVDRKELQLTAYVYSDGTVLVDADDTFFACTLIREGPVSLKPKIDVQNYFSAGEGGRLRAESMFVCHQKARALPIVDYAIAAFERVFVVSPRGTWLALATCLKTHGIVSIGLNGTVAWIAKSTMLVVVSPSYISTAAEAFVMLCELHNLRIAARALADKDKSDVRFAIGLQDARLLADKGFSSDGPRWTRTCDMFAPFYARSPYVVLTVGPVAIYSSLDRALAPVQAMLEGSEETVLVRAMRKLIEDHGDDSVPAEDVLAGLDPEQELAVFRATDSVSLSIAARGSVATEVGDVVLIARKGANTRASREWNKEWGERWEIAHQSGDYNVYRNVSAAPGFGSSFCLYTP